MKLSILMPALVQRRHLRMRIEMSLRAQMDGKPVELLIEEDAGEAASGAKRARLMSRARGEYVAFVDDDDRVSGHYIADLLDAIDRGPDVVTFLLRRADTGVIWKLGLDQPDWERLAPGVIGMAANHLCAWRREIAAAVRWSPLGYGDDQAWYKPLHAARLAAVEVHVPRVLYVYCFDWAVTANQSRARINETRQRFAGGMESFLDDDGRVLVATRGRQETLGRDIIDVLTPTGEVVQRRRSRLQKLCNVRF